MRKVLALGGMPANATPATHLAAGPWCFCGLENLFPDWESSFRFAPEPLANPGSLPRAARQAQALAMAAMPKIAQALTPNHAEFPEIYWQTLLAPWCIAAASQIVERWLRVEAMLASWGGLELHVPLLPGARQFNFLDEEDYNLRGALGESYNWWLFSRLLEMAWPQAWSKAYADMPEKAAKPRRKGLKDKIRNLLLALPFPPLKGMSVFQALAFSAALLHKTGLPKARSRRELFANAESLASLPAIDQLMPLFFASLPASIKNLSHPPLAKSLATPRLRVAPISAYENVSLRQKLASWKGRGGRLAFAQHGGNYGQARVVCNSAFVEYAEDLFFTWGWRKHGTCRGNFLPMPWPQLQRNRDAWKMVNANIIFAGTEMACHAYRLESRPTPLQFTRYRQDKLRFLGKLEPALLERLYYRPYFNLPGTLQDASWLKKRFPSLKICRGPLFPWLKSCAVLVLDHPGTIMLEAFSAGVPTILFWDPQAWPWTDESEALREDLAEAGIWHASPESAAAKLEEILPDPARWRTSPAVEKCVANYCKFQACTIESGFMKTWLTTLKKL